MGFRNPLQSLVIGSGDLAQEIATNISVSGAPPIDAMKIIHTSTYTTGAGGVFVGPIDTSGYQSVTVLIREDNGNIAIPPIPRAVTCRFGWVGNDRVTDEFCGTDDSAPTGAYETSYRCPVRGPVLYLGLSPTSVVGTSLTITVMGSYKTITTPGYVHRSAVWGISGAVTSGNAVDNFASASWSSVPTLVPIADYPPSKNGNAQITCRARGTSGQSINFWLLDLRTGIPLYNSGVLPCPANGYIDGPTVPLILPNRPVSTLLLTSGLATPVWPSASIVLTYSD
jgi:hypothetical protein